MPSELELAQLDFAQAAKQKDALQAVQMTATGLDRVCEVLKTRFQWFETDLERIIREAARSTG